MPSYKISYEDFNVNYLKTDETVKMNSYRNLNDKVNYFISHSFINIFFSKLMNTTIEKLRYEVAEDKKPYIKNEYDIHYNISHTKGYCIIALSQKAIGIDIEYMDKDFEYEDIVKYSFSLKDGKCIKNFEDFYTYWAVKESYLKYKGSREIGRASCRERV